MAIQTGRKHRWSAAKQLYCIEGEVEIGSSKVIIEHQVADENRYTSAYSRAQAVKQLALRFRDMFGVRVYLGNAQVFPVKVLRPDIKPVRSILKRRMADEKTPQLRLNL